MNQTSIEATAFRGSETEHVLPSQDIWVLLWSQSQNALHIERVNDMQRSNLDAFSGDRRMDYVPLQIGSREAVDAAANAVRPICHARAAREA